MTNIALAYQGNTLEAYAKKLTEQLKLPLVPPDTTHYPILLIVKTSGLELSLTDSNKGPLRVDFLKGALNYRRLFGGGRSQLIARAIGLKSYSNPTVLDLTAGLGRDAFILATLGCDVIMLERNPIMAALLKDGLKRAEEAAWFRSLKLKFIEAEAKSYLSNLKTTVDVIYMDPMHPSRKKSALVKKEMQILRMIVGANEDAPQLLALSIEKAKYRVVVKRPRIAPALLKEPKPNITYNGKSSRFDVYIPKV